MERYPLSKDVLTDTKPTSFLVKFIILNLVNIVVHIVCSFGILCITSGWFNLNSVSFLVSAETLHLLTTGCCCFAADNIFNENGFLLFNRDFDWLVLGDDLFDWYFSFNIYYFVYIVIFGLFRYLFLFDYCDIVCSFNDWLLNRDFVNNFLDIN